MDPISNVDQLVLVLRRKLLERTKTTGRAERKSATPDRAAAGLDSVYALARIDGVDDRQLGRALIQSILAEQFGAKMINEAKFQQVVDRVVDALRGDEAGARLLANIVRELRLSAHV